MLLEVAFTLVASVFGVVSAACTFVAAIKKGVAAGPKRNTGKDKETKRAQKLKSLERKMKRQQTEKPKLEERMNKAMETLGSKMLVLKLTYGMGSIILQRSYQYARIRVLILMLVLYVYIVIPIAFERIKETKKLVQDFQRRQIKLQNNVENLKDKIERHNSDCKSNKTKKLNTQNGGSLSNRIAKLQEAASEILEISKFEDELNLLYKDANQFGISFTIIAYFGFGLFW